MFGVLRAPHLVTESKRSWLGSLKISDTCAERGFLYLFPIAFLRTPQSSDRPASLLVILYKHPKLLALGRWI